MKIRKSAGMFWLSIGTVWISILVPIWREIETIDQIHIIVIAVWEMATAAFYRADELGKERRMLGMDGKN